MSHGHSHGHGHGHGDGPSAQVGTLSRLVVIVLLAAAAVASVVGVATLWPDQQAEDALKGSVAFSAPGVTYPHADVDRVNAPCPLSDGSDGSPAGSPVPDGTCGTIEATITEGSGTGRQVSLDVPPDVAASGLGAGDRIELQLTPAADGQPGQASYFGTSRGAPLLWLLVAFVVVVLLVARLRGLMALVGLAFSGLVVA